MNTDELAGATRAMVELALKQTEVLILPRNVSVILILTDETNGATGWVASVHKQRAVEIMAGIVSSEVS